MTWWSFSTCVDYGVPIEEQIIAGVRAGFSHVSPSRPSHAGYDTAQGRGLLRRLCEEHGLAVESLHAPRVLGPDGASALRRTIEAAEALDAGVVVVHATEFEIQAEYRRSALTEALDLCKAVEPVLRGSGVVLALENLMPGSATAVVEELLGHLDPTLFGFCFDSSHDQIDGPRPLDLLERQRARLAALHLSDRSAPFVDHLAPGDGFVDWAAIGGQLRAAGYARPILLELIRRDQAEDLIGLLQRARERARDLLAAPANSSP